MITALDKNTALLVVDLQVGIVATPLVHPAAPIVQHAARLAAAFRQAGRPVVLLRADPTDAARLQARTQESALPRPAAERAQALRAMRDGGYFELVPELAPQPGDEQLVHADWNCFYGTGLGDLLRQHQITGLVLAGIATSKGVEGTARAASEQGYNLAFAEDALTDLTRSAHESSLQNVFPQIGEIGTTDALIAHLPRRA